MKGTIKPNMLGIRMKGIQNNDLESLLSKSFVLPVSYFLVTDIDQAISDGIQFLTERRYGSLHIPPQGNIREVILTVSIDKEQDIRINLTTENHRPPVNMESRPYNLGMWIEGDIIKNNSVSDSNTTSWVCISKGIPGKWNQSSTIEPFSSHIEKLDYLPQPSELQLGRQIRYVMNGLECLFICKIGQDNTPVWVQQDYIIGTNTQKPADPVNGTIYYNTTEDRFEWYSDKAKKWYRIEQIQDEMLKWDRQYQEMLKTINDLNTKVNSSVDTTTIIYKEPIQKFADLNTTYPEPENGWAVYCEENGRWYRYSDRNRTWEYFYKSLAGGISGGGGIEFMPQGYYIPYPQRKEGIYYLDVKEEKVKKTDSIDNMYWVNIGRVDNSLEQEYSQYSDYRESSNVEWLERSVFSGIKPVLMNIKTREYTELDKKDIRKDNLGNDVTKYYGNADYAFGTIIPEIFYKVGYDGVRATSEKKNGLVRFPLKEKYKAVFVGAFEGSISNNKLLSTPKVSVHRGGIDRKFVSEYGQGASFLNYEVLKIFQILYLIYYKTFSTEFLGMTKEDTFEVTGNSVVLDESKFSYGNINSHTSFLKDLESGINCSKFLWIENMSSNGKVIIDGIVSKNGAIHLSNDIDTISDENTYVRNSDNRPFSRQPIFEVDSFALRDELPFFPSNGSTGGYVRDAPFSDTRETDKYLVIGKKLGNLENNNTYLFNIGSQSDNTSGSTRLVMYLTEDEYLNKSRVITLIYHNTKKGDVEEKYSVNYNIKIRSIDNSDVDIPVGHKLVGFTSEVDSGTLYPIGSSFTDTGSNVVHLYPKFEEYKTIKVSFKLDLSTASFSGGSTAKEIHIKQYSKIGILPVPVNTGREKFKGWSCDINGVDTIVTEDFIIPEVDNLEIKARWGGNVAITFKTDYHSNIFSNVDLKEPILYTEGFKMGKMPKIRTLENISTNSESVKFIFDGWYTEKNGLGKKYDENTILDKSNDFILYANYIKGNSESIYNLQHTLEFKDLSNKTIYRDFCSPGLMVYVDVQELIDYVNKEAFERNIACLFYKNNNIFQNDKFRGICLINNSYDLSNESFILEYETKKEDYVNIYIPCHVGYEHKRTVVKKVKRYEKINISDVVRQICYNLLNFKKIAFTSFYGSIICNQNIRAIYDEKLELTEENLYPGEIQESHIIDFMKNKYPSKTYFKFMYDSRIQIKGSNPLRYMVPNNIQYSLIIDNCRNIKELVDKFIPESMFVAGGNHNDFLTVNFKSEITSNTSGGFEDVTVPDKVVTGSVSGNTMIFKIEAKRTASSVMRGNFNIMDKSPITVKSSYNYDVLFRVPYFIDRNKGVNEVKFVFNIPVPQDLKFILSNSDFFNSGYSNTMYVAPTYIESFYESLDCYEDYYIKGFVTSPSNGLDISLTSNKLSIGNELNKTLYPVYYKKEGTFTLKIYHLITEMYDFEGLSDTTGYQQFTNKGYYVKLIKTVQVEKGSKLPKEWAKYHNSEYAKSCNYFSIDFNPNIEPLGYLRVIEDNICIYLTNLEDVNLLEG
nr:MAG TPA: hypothetical protein [Caudoviricetes sp.]